MPAPTGPRRRIRDHAAWLIGTLTLAATAFLVSSLGAVGGTYALWTDRAAVTPTATVHTGTPQLEVRGFGSLNGHVYTAESLTASGTVTVANTGDVALHHFHVTHRAVAGEGAELLAALDVRFTPAGASGPGATFDTWLAGLTLEPGARAVYTVTTSLDAAELEPLAEMHAVIAVSVTGHAGNAVTAPAAWPVDTESEFAQTVGRHDDSFGVCFAPHSDPYQVSMNVTAEISRQTNYLIKAEGEQLLTGNGSPATFNEWNTTVSISHQMLKRWWPAQIGDTREITITGVHPVTGEVVLRGRLQVTRVYTDAAHVIPLTLCPSTFSGQPVAPAPTTPPESTPEPEEASTPVVPSAPDPTPQPRETSAPTPDVTEAPAATPAPENDAS